MPRIVLEGVSKSFAAPDEKSVAALDGLSLAVEDKELLTLVGPSGCGKTTTLRLIAGLEMADAGRILFDDEPVTTLPPIDRDVAMVFQSHALFPHLTAFDNIAFGLKLRSVSKAEINSRVRETAELLGITYCLERKPGKLSGGERQRVALGRALSRRPRILLLDEPLSHLDEPLRVQMRTELLILRSRLDVTVIYVTHDQAEALALGDRVAVMHQGRLQQIGTPREIYTTPDNTFVAGFVGSPPMNLFHGTVTLREGQLVFIGAETVPTTPSSQFVLPLDGWRADWLSQNLGRPILLGIRPECIGLAANGPSNGPARTITAMVQSTQFLGVETIHRCPVGERDIVVRSGPDCVLRPGQSASLAFDLSQAHIFDAVSGALLL